MLLFIVILLLNLILFFKGDIILNRNNLKQNTFKTAVLSIIFTALIVILVDESIRDLILRIVWLLKLPSPY